MRMSLKISSSAARQAVVMVKPIITEIAGGRKNLSAAYKFWIGDKNYER
jgi:hypothetical protein